MVYEAIAVADGCMPDDMGCVPTYVIHWDMPDDTSEVDPEERIDWSTPDNVRRHNGAYQIDTGRII